MCFNRDRWGTCPLAQWLGCCDLTAGAGGHSLIRELRSRRLNSQKKKKKITMDWSPFMPPKHHVNVSHESLPFTLITRVKYVLGIFLFSHVQFQQPRTFVQHQLTIFLPASLPIIILGTSTSPWVVPLSPWPLSPSGLFSDFAPAQLATVAITHMVVPVSQISISSLLS